MSKLIFKSDRGYSIELDVTEKFKLVRKNQDIHLLDESIDELKQLIKDSVRPKFKRPKFWFE